MKTIIIALFPLLISITIAVPIKYPHNFDDLMSRENSFKHFDDNQYGARSLDSIGGGNLIRSPDNYDGNSPMHWYLKDLDNDEAAATRTLLLQLPGRRYYKRRGYIGNDMDSLYSSVRNLDSIGGGNLIRALDSIGGGHLVKKSSSLDSIGGGHLIG